VAPQDPYRSTYDKTQDSFRHLEFAVAPCAVLGLLTNLIRGFNIMEVRVGSCCANSPLSFSPYRTTPPTTSTVSLR
jgi:hypothetical protein